MGHVEQSPFLADNGLNVLYEILAFKQHIGDLRVHFFIVENVQPKFGEVGEMKT